MKKQIMSKHGFTEDDFQFMMNNMKTQYFRVGGKWKKSLTDLTSDIYCRGIKKGIMIAAIHPKDHNRVIIGWSLQHKKFDRFRRDTAIHIALGRALAWDDENRCENKVFPTFIPASMSDQFQIFIEKMEKFFSGKTMSKWVKDSFIVRSHPWPGLMQSNVWSQKSELQIQ